MGETATLKIGYYKAECIISVTLNPTPISKPRSMGQQVDTFKKNTHHQWRICISTIFQIIQ